jgi:hypothetical protein
MRGQMPPYPPNAGAWRRERFFLFENTQNARLEALQLAKTASSDESFLTVHGRPEMTQDCADTARRYPRRFAQNALISNASKKINQTGLTAGLYSLRRTREISKSSETLECAAFG